MAIICGRIKVDSCVVTPIETSLKNILSHRSLLLTGMEQIMDHDIVAREKEREVEGGGREEGERMYISDNK